MSSRRYSGCEGLPNDGLQKSRARLRDRGESTPKSAQELGSSEHHAERRRLQQRDATRFDRSEKGRGGSCTG